MNIRRVELLLAWLLFGVALTRATVIRVPADQPTIQTGITAASNGDTVLVDPGTYFENINFRGKSILVTSRYVEASDTAYITSTIINGSNPSNPDSASTVLIVSGEDSTAVLQGFTITGGSGTNWTDEHGAGVYREGGGILIALSSPTIRNNLITGNAVAKSAQVTSAGGGGIRAGDGNPTILNNVITANTGRYGAGVVLNYTGALLRNNIITRNSGGQDYGGGALWMNHDGAKPKLIENSTIAGNSVIAVYVWQGSSAIRNCIILADSTVSSSQIGVRSGGPTISYSFVQGGWTGTGNISGNPGFSDEAFHLATASPCLDAGDTADAYNDREDPLAPGSALWPSRGGMRNDMGAYGGPGAAVLPLIARLTSVPPAVRLLPTVTRLEQNYPNPFNPSTAIRYQLADAGNVSLSVITLLGSEVAVLVNEDQQPGSYVVRFDGFRLASGVYFARLVARGGSGQVSRQVTRMVLMK